jgi:TPR repeat protein
VGNIYRDGNDDLERDHVMALKLYSDAAAAGDPVARFRSGDGNMYTDTLKKRTSLTDNLNCFVTVGDIYYYGDAELTSIDRDDDMAFKLYKVAAENKNAEAQFKLGEMYRRGLGVKKNSKEARGLYQLAAEKGHENAKNMLKN